MCKHTPACPLNWDCAKRGSREDALARYADQHHRTYTTAYKDERSPDGRSIYADHCGEYTRGAHEKAETK